MYPIINKKPHFLPFDICKVRLTGGLVFIREVNLNTSQNKDEHQWSYSVIIIDKTTDNKVAWYSENELLKINNLFELLANVVCHPFGSNEYKFSLESKRRNK